MDSPSNKLRALQNQTQTMMRDLGTTMLPTVSSVISMASAGLTDISPIVTAAGESINRITTALLNLSPSAKAMLLITIGSAVAIPLATKAQTLYTTANKGWGSLLNILIPKEKSRAAILKSTVGWIAILAALMAGLADIGATRREMEDGKQAENLEQEGKNASAASEGVGELGEAYNDLGAGAESAKRSLADIDTLNIFGSGSASTGGIDFDAVVAGAENATDSVGGLTDGIGDIIGETESLQDELDGLNLGGLTGEGFNLMQTIKDIGLGAQTLWDAFDFDSDTQLTSLRTLNEKIKQLFGEDWTNFWNGVGGTVYDAFSGEVNSVKQENALKEIQGWLDGMMFMPDGWNDFWKSVGSSIYERVYGGMNESRGGAGGREREGGGGGGGCSRGGTHYWDEIGWEYQDYSAFPETTYSSRELLRNPSLSHLPDRPSGTFADSTGFFGTIHTTVELDKQLVGEIITEYQNGEDAKSNGY